MRVSLPIPAEVTNQWCDIHREKTANLLQLANTQGEFMVRFEQIPKVLCVCVCVGGTNTTNNNNYCTGYYNYINNTMYFKNYKNKYDNIQS